MPEILEIEQVETKKIPAIGPKWNSWIVEVPDEIIASQNLAGGSLAVLTLRDGKIEGEIASCSDDIAAISNEILQKRSELYEELKQLGD